MSFNVGSSKGSSEGQTQLDPEIKNRWLQFEGRADDAYRTIEQGYKTGSAFLDPSQMVAPLNPLHYEGIGAIRNAADDGKAALNAAGESAFDFMTGRAGVPQGQASMANYFTGQPSTNVQGVDPVQSAFADAYLASSPEMGAVDRIGAQNIDLSGLRATGAAGKAVGAAAARIDPSAIPKVNPQATTAARATAAQQGAVDPMRAAAIAPVGKAVTGDAVASLARAPTMEAARIGDLRQAQAGVAKAAMASTPGMDAAKIGNLERSQAFDANAALVNRGAVRDVAAQTFPGANISDYMNPYEDQAVSRVLGDIEQFADRRQNTRRSDATLNGAFGGNGFGSRQAVEAGLIEEAAVKQAGDTSAAMRQAGFRDATQTQQSDAERLFRAGQTNQGVDLSVLGDNANRSTDISQFNAGQRTETSRFDTENQVQRAMEQARLGQEAGAENLRASLTTGIRNADAQTDVNRFNVQTQADLDRFNAENQVQRAFENARMGQEAGRANLDVGAAAELANAAARTGVSQFNTQNRADLSRFNVQTEAERAIEQARLGQDASARTFDAGVQRSSANADRAQQVALENARAGNTATENSAERALQAALTGQGLGYQALAANAGFGQEAALDYARAQTQMSDANAGREQQALLDYFGRETGARTRTAELGLDAAGQNQQTALQQILARYGTEADTGRFNAGQLSSTSEANAGRATSTGIRNAELGQQRNLTQADLDFRTGQSNMDAFNRMVEGNTGRSQDMTLANLGYQDRGLDRMVDARRDIADLGERQQQLGFNEGDALLRAGDVQRGVQQQSADAWVNEMLRRQGMPQEAINAYSTAFGFYPSTSSGGTTTQRTKGSTVGGGTK